jgi:hypothetical protein
MGLIAVVDAAPAILLEGHFPGVSALIEPPIDALAHVHAIVFAAGE